MDFIYILSSPIVAFFIAYISIPAIIKISDLKGLYDEPDGERKAHKHGIPALGGIAIFGGFVITLAFFVDFVANPELGYTLSAITILFFTGLKDDLVPLTPRKKFVAQLIAALIIVIRCDIRITDLHGFLGIQELSYSLSIILSMITVLGIVNAFNLIDGINGLAGGIAVIVSSTFGTLFWMMGEVNLAILGFTLGGACIGFLIFNFRNKIFMGDTGALTIGMISAIFCVQFIELNNETTTLFPPPFVPVFAFAILIIPLFDTIRVVIIRLSKKMSPFSGDRNHLHHLLVDSGLTHAQASSVLYLVNLSFIGMAWMCQILPQILLLISILSTATALSMILFYFKMKKELNASGAFNSQPKYSFANFKNYLEREFSSK